ncbi:hypothetical protein T492DRAFT_1126923 [Pavlovales sp. CCMP2436]|nr:hypothetical protein T492DRAFT_1126923 [Pavlovales sp. CCMP2436]
MLIYGGATRLGVVRRRTTCSGCSESGRPHANVVVRQRSLGLDELLRRRALLEHSPSHGSTWQLSIDCLLPGAAVGCAKEGCSDIASRAISAAVGYSYDPAPRPRAPLPGAGLPDLSSSSKYGISPTSRPVAGGGAARPSSSSKYGIPPTPRPVAGAGAVRTAMSKPHPSRRCRRLRWRWGVSDNREQRAARAALGSTASSRRLAALGRGGSDNREQREQRSARSASDATTVLKGQRRVEQSPGARRLRSAKPRSAEAQKRGGSEARRLRSAEAQKRGGSEARRLRSAEPRSVEPRSAEPRKREQIVLAKTLGSSFVPAPRCRGQF